MRCPECGARVTLTAQKTRATPPSAGGAGRDADQLVGAVLGGYRITSVIGGGGMGIVYEATRVDGDGPEQAAIKVLSPVFAEDPDFVARFRREADALIRLRHPHLIEVYEKGEHAPEGGGPTAYYFVMERFDGVDLRRYVQTHELTVETVLAIVREAAAGLAYAHEHGVVHRDIKPGNILVRGDPAGDGLVKVVDFGVAQLASPGQTLTSLTRSDLILGTFNYMSPEQRIDASRIDHRADVYALGVVAYELLTGSLPMGAFEPPSELRPDLPKATDRALLAALRRDPDQRPATVAQFARALEVATRPARRWAWAPLAAAAGLLVAAGAWGLNQSVGVLGGDVAPKAKQVAKSVEAKAPVVKAPVTTKGSAPQEGLQNVGVVQGEQALTPEGLSDEDLGTLADLLRGDAEYIAKRAAADRRPSKSKIRKTRKPVTKRAPVSKKKLEVTKSLAPKSSASVGPAPVTKTPAKAPAPEAAVAEDAPAPVEEDASAIGEAVPPQVRSTPSSSTPKKKKISKRRAAD